MNRRQWRILTLGALAVVLVSALGMIGRPAPTASPRVEDASGRASQEFTDAVVPKWAVLVSLGLAGLTAAAVYTSRGQSHAEQSWLLRSTRHFQCRAIKFTKPLRG